MPIEPITASSSLPQAPAQTKPKKLLFCTSSIRPETLDRYVGWADYYTEKFANYESIMMFNDGPVDPSLMIQGVEIIPILPHLGRPSHHYFPGWVRSFVEGLKFSIANGFGEPDLEPSPYTASGVRIAVNGVTVLVEHLTPSQMWEHIQGLRDFVMAEVKRQMDGLSPEAIKCCLEAGWAVATKIDIDTPEYLKMSLTFYGLAYGLFIALKKRTGCTLEQTMDLFGESVHAFPAARIALGIMFKSRN
jgi:hypothetical protein